MLPHLSLSSFFFFNDTATTEIYTLSLHDALPIYPILNLGAIRRDVVWYVRMLEEAMIQATGELGIAAKRVEGKDRKSTRLNSSHGYISYAVFCLKKKKKRKDICDPASR